MDMRTPPALTLAALGLAGHLHNMHDTHITIAIHNTQQSALAHLKGTIHSITSSEHTSPPHLASLDDSTQTFNTLHFQFATAYLIATAVSMHPQ